MSLKKYFIFVWLYPTKINKIYDLYCHIFFAISSKVNFLSKHYSYKHYKVQKKNKRRW